METSTADPFEVVLPAKLAQRLRDAGGVDQASMDALLARDPRLRVEVQVAIQTFVLDRFAAIPDSNALLDWADRFPFMLEAGFSEAVEERLLEAEKAGHTDLIAASRQRLEGLDSLRAQAEGRYGEMEAPPVVQALMAFLAADDEEAARQVFARCQDLLDSDEAAQVLGYQFGSDDPAAWKTIQARTQLLAALRREAARARAAGDADAGPPPSRASLLAQLAERQAVLAKMEEQVILAVGREEAVLRVEIEREQAAIADLQRRLDEMG